MDEHRAARRGARRDATSDEEVAHDVDVCGVCPICVALRALGDTRPELLAHLTEAGRHLAAAARTLLEEHVSDGETSAPEGHVAGHDRVTRIDLD